MQTLPLGYQQVIGAQVPPVFGLTVPVGRNGVQPNRVMLRAEGGTIRWRDDGGEPTATVGMLFTAGQQIIYDGDLNAIRFYQTAGTVLGANFYYASGYPSEGTIRSGPYVEMAANYAVRDGLQQQIGYEQITVLGTATVYGLTIPKTINGIAPRSAWLISEVSPIRFRDDGIDPTSTTGYSVNPNTVFVYEGDLASLRIINAAAGAILNVIYYT